MVLLRHKAGECYGDYSGTNVFFQYSAAIWLLPLDRREIRMMLIKLLRASHDAGITLHGVDLHVVSDAEIAAVNLQYLGCKGPTNIISFPGANRYQGILVLSADTFFRECQLYGQEPFVHLARLLSHGFGHLAGYDHGEAMNVVCDACFEAVMKNWSCCK